MKKITDPVLLENEYNRFIEALRINPAKLESLEESISNKSSEKEKLIKLISVGLVIVNDNNQVVFNIFEPVQHGEKLVEKLTFRKDKPKVKDIEKYGVGKTDMEKTRRIFSFLLDDGETYPSAFFSQMESDDLNNFAQVAAFFLPQ
jgi:hypothetical protein